MLRGIKSNIKAYIKNKMGIFRPFLRLISGARKYPLSKGKLIIKQAKQHLALSISGQENSRLPALSKRWQEYSGRIRKEINNIKYAHEAIYFGQNSMGFDHRLLSVFSRPIIPLYKSILKREFPCFTKAIDGISDSPYSLPETLVRFEGQLVSNIFFFHLRYVLYCLTYIKEPKVVCEIGGGYGGPARLWLQNPVYCPKAYVIIDLPESLFFAEVFLRANFENSNILYVTDSRPISIDDTKQYSIILCPIKFIDATSHLSFDLVINTGAIEEMPDKWVDYWMNWLKQQDCKYFYSLGYFAQPLNNMGEACNVWSPRLTKEWTIKAQNFNPHFYMTQTIRNCAEILASKIGGSNQIDKASLAARYDSLKNRFMDGQTLLEAMDVVRLYLNEGIIWDLLNRCISEMRIVPSQAYYLAEYLSAYGSAEFLEKNAVVLQAISAKLDKLRSSGREDLWY